MYRSLDRNLRKIDLILVGFRKDGPISVQYITVSMGVPRQCATARFQAKVTSNNKNWVFVLDLIFLLIVRVGIHVNETQV